MSYVDNVAFLKLKEHPKTKDIIQVDFYKTEECAYNPSENSELENFLERITHLGKDILLSLNTVDNKGELNSVVDRRLN